MSKSQSPIPIDNPQEDIQTAYQAAIQLMTYEGQLSWSTTSIFVTFAVVLIAGAVFPSFLGSSNAKIIALVGFLFSLAGLTASIMWWSMVARTRRYYEYWTVSARELEKFMSPAVQTLQRGEVLSRGNEITVDGSVMKFKFIERIRMGSNFYLFYGVFTAIFFLLVLLNLYRVIAAFPII